MKRYLISGIGPSHHGVGRVMEYLVPRAHNADYSIITTSTRRPIISYVRTYDVFGFIRDVIMSWFSRILFNVRVKFIRHTEVILIHPQTIGWANVLRLCKWNSVRFYVMDNSFFCIRSYNHRSGKYGECLDCLGNVDRCDASCKPYPVKYRKRMNLRYLRAFAEYASQIRFYSQTSTQSRLLEMHFGKILCEIIGLATHEFNELLHHAPRMTQSRGPGHFDIVYHAAIDEAKGISYILELAAHLPELRFLVPANIKVVRSRFPDLRIPRNVTFRSMTWETGLKERVEMCGLVLCPSLWSAPMEGALIKSLIHNGRVAVFDTRYGYQQELPDGLVLRLGNNLQSAAAAVRTYLSSGGPDRMMLDTWTRELAQSINIGRLFD